MLDNSKKGLQTEGESEEPLDARAASQHLKDATARLERLLQDKLRRPSVKASCSKEGSFLCLIQFAS